MVEVGAQSPGPGLHAADAATTRHGTGVEPTAIILDEHFDLRAHLAHGDLDVAGAGVPQRIGDGLLHDAQQLQRLRGLQRLALQELTHVPVQLDAGGLDPLLQPVAQHAQQRRQLARGGFLRIHHQAQVIHAFAQHGGGLGTLMRPRSSDVSEEVSVATESILHLAHHAATLVEHGLELLHAQLLPMRSGKPSRRGAAHRAAGRSRRAWIR